MRPEARPERVRRGEVKPGEALVLGAGAVGLALGSALLAAGQRVRFGGRPDTVEALRQGGLRRSGIFGEHTAPPSALSACTSLADAPHPPAAILVCVKSFDSPAAARALAEHPKLLEAGAPVVHFQNGWGNAEVFAEALGRERVYSARVITGFRRSAPNAVEVTVHADAIHIGSLFGGDLAKVEPLARAIDTGGLPCRVSGDVARDLWAKLLYSCSLNPLGALLGVSYGALGETEPTRRILESIAREVFAVMSASGYATHWPSPEAWLRDLHERLLPPTGAHESSMLQDLRAARRTEIDALCGEIVRLGAAKHVPTPVNAALADLIRFLEPPPNPGS